MMQDVFSQSEMEFQLDLACQIDAVMAQRLSWHKPDDCLRIDGLSSLLQCAIECATCPQGIQCQPDLLRKTWPAPATEPAKEWKRVPRRAA